MTTTATSLTFGLPSLSSRKRTSRFTRSPLGSTTIWLAMVCVSTPRIVNHPRRLPALAAVRRPGKERWTVHQDALGRVRKGESVPDGVDQAAVPRIGGDALFVVGNRWVGVGNQGDRLAPPVTAVCRSADQDRLVRIEEVKRQRNLMRNTIGRDTDPRVRRALVVAIVRGVATLAPREVREGTAPRLTAIVRDAGDQAACTAVLPAILLPHPDEIGAIARIHGDPGFDLCIQVVELARECLNGAVGEWARPRHAHEL